MSKIHRRKTEKWRLHSIFRVIILRMIIFISFICFTVQYFEKKRKETVLYYCLYLSPKDSAHDISLQNLNFFLKYGVFDNNGVDYVFIIPNGSAAINVTFPNYGNVEIRHIQNYHSDISNFYSQLQRDDDEHEYFIFMNVGVRGPFLSLNNSKWHHELISRMESSLMLGTSFSCEVKLHLQSHFLMMNRYGVQLAKKTWNECFEKKMTHRDVIEECEVGLSTEFIRNGHKFASMERKYRNLDLVKMAGAWRVDYNRLCDHVGNPIKMEEIEPFEVMFVKYGGQIYRENLIHKKTISNVEDCEKIMERNWM